MGRAGGGSSGGSGGSGSGGHFGGGRSFSSRSGGGHRPTGSRAGGGFRAGSSQQGGYGPGGFGPGPEPYGPRRVYHFWPFGRRHYSVMGAAPLGCFGSVLIPLIVVVVVFVLVVSLGSGGADSDIPASTSNRTRIETGLGFQNDCIVDELGWIDNISATERRLQTFYDLTGAQPYVYLRGYDPTLRTEAEKLQFAENWYDAHINNEATFLFIYFAEEDTDYDVGYMTYVNGHQVSSVMDAEAIEIFWAITDSAWFSDLSTDDVIVRMFNDTAERIMKRTTTAADVWKIVAICAGVVAIIVAIIILMKTKRKHAAEKAKETERILNTPIDHPEDPLRDKYENRDP